VTEVKACIDKFIDPVQAAHLAIQTNPENAPKLPEGLRKPGTHSRDLRAAGVILTGRKWPNGKILKCAHLEGENLVQQRVQQTAYEWQKYVNLRLAWVENPNDAEIRISYDKNDGSWSYLGTSNLEIPKNEATMNFGWLEPNTSQTEYNRVVLHEFGHAFGYPHEHNHPKAGIPWDVEAVYEYYTRTQGWTREDVDQQVFARYSESQTQFGEYDKLSIMHYPVDNSLTTGDYEVGWNTKLSEGDIKFAEWQYPKDVVPDPPAPVQARVKLSLSTLYRNPSRYYGKDLTIEYNRKPRWDAEAL